MLQSRHVIRRIITNTKPTESLHDLLPKIPKPSAERKFLETLFPDSNHRIIIQQQVPVDAITTTRALSNLKLTENVANIYALLESHQVDSAERVFYRTWRTNRNDMDSVVDIKMIEKFISVYLLRQRMNMKRDGIEISLDDEVRALEWFNDIESKYAKQPGIHTFALLVSYFLDACNLEKSRELLLKMEAKGLPIDQLLNDECFQDHSRSSTLEALLNSMGIVC